MVWKTKSERLLARKCHDTMSAYYEALDKWQACPSGPMPRKPAIAQLPKIAPAGAPPSEGPTPHGPAHPPRASSSPPRARPSAANRWAKSVPTCLPGSGHSPRTTSIRYLGASSSFGDATCPPIATSLRELREQHAAREAQQIRDAETRKGENCFPPSPGNRGPGERSRAKLGSMDLTS